MELHSSIIITYLYGFWIYLVILEKMTPDSIRKTSLKLKTLSWATPLFSISQYFVLYYDSVVSVDSEMPRQDQNGNDLASEKSSPSSSSSDEVEKQNRINRNLAKFLSTEKQQQQLLLCLRQQQLPKPQHLRLGALTSTTVACTFFFGEKLQS